MIFLNNQVKYVLPKDKDGNRDVLTGEKLFNAREIHSLMSTAETFTLTSTNNFYVVGITEMNTTIPVFTNAGTDADGILNGGLAVAGIAANNFNIFNDGTVSLGGRVINITPLLDKNHNEVLKENGDDIYVLAGVRSDLVTEGNTLIPGSLQLSFVSLRTDGTFQPEMIKRGVYNYYLNGVYGFANARKLELPFGGSVGNQFNIAGSSREEVIDLVDEYKTIPGYSSFTYLADSNLESTEGYTAKFVLDTLGNANPVFSIVGGNTGNTGASGNLNFYGKGIRAESGSGRHSDIEFYLNGSKVPDNNVTVTVTGTVVEITLDNTSGKFATGDIFKGDVFEVTYRSEVPKAAEAPILTLEAVTWVGTSAYKVKLGGLLNSSGTASVRVIISDNVSSVNLHDAVHHISFDGTVDTNDLARATGLTGAVYDNRNNSVITVTANFDNGTSRTQVFNF